MSRQSGAAPVAILDPAEHNELREVVAEVFGGAEPVRRAPHVMGSSYPLWELDLRRGDGSVLLVLLKDLGAQKRRRGRPATKPAFLHDPMREIDAYRDGLRGGEFGTPRLLGVHIDAGRDRFWLFLEAVDGTPLWQIGDPALWESAAAWLAGFHDRAPDAYAGSLIEYDAAYFDRWLGRALRISPGAGLERLGPGYAAVVSSLATAPRSRVHGEFYPSNILVRAGGQGSICPVDFELTGVGSGLLDLAALSTGLPDAVAARVVDAYFEARSCPPPRAELDRLLLCARLHLAVQWLGWSSGWQPPRQHATDWAKEAHTAAARLGVLA